MTASGIQSDAVAARLTPDVTAISSSDGSLDVSSSSGPSNEVARSVVHCLCYFSLLCGILQSCLPNHCGSHFLLVVTHAACNFMFQSFQSINQSTNQSINQPINQ